MKIGDLVYHPYNPKGFGIVVEIPAWQDGSDLPTCKVKMINTSMVHRFHSCDLEVLS